MPYLHVGRRGHCQNWGSLRENEGQRPSRGRSGREKHNLHQREPGEDLRQPSTVFLEKSEPRSSKSQVRPCKLSQRLDFSMVWFTADDIQWYIKIVYYTCAWDSDFYPLHVNYFLLLICRILNNNDWYCKQSVVDFLSTLGRKFRIGSMMHRERLLREIVEYFVDFEVRDTCYDRKHQLHIFSAV